MDIYYKTKYVWVSKIWFAWAILSEEELSWAIYKIYNIVNVYKQQNLFYFLIFFYQNTEEKREQHNHQTRELFVLALKPVYHFDSMEVVAILSEFSHLSGIFDDILLFFYFILEKSSS